MQKRAMLIVLHSGHSIDYESLLSLLPPQHFFFGFGATATQCKNAGFLLFLSFWLLPCTLSSCFKPW